MILDEVFNFCSFMLLFGKRRNCYKPIVAYSDDSVCNSNHHLNGKKGYHPYDTGIRYI